VESCFNNFICARAYSMSPSAMRAVRQAPRSSSFYSAHGMTRIGGFGAWSSEVCLSGGEEAS